MNTQGRPTTWTSAQVEQLIQMRSEGVSVSQIASRLGKTTGAVSGKISALKAQGKIVETAGESQETGELNELETEMSEIIKEQKAEIEKLTTRITELEASNKKLEEENDGLLGKGIELHNRASDLDRELLDTRAALAKTEQQFDEYRKETESASAEAEAEVSRLTRALERANRIALGVVERFALTDCAV